MSTLFIDLDGTLLDVSERYYRIYLQGISENKEPLSKSRFWELKRSGWKDEEIYKQGGHEYEESIASLKSSLIEHKDYLALDRLHNGDAEFLIRAKQEHQLILITIRKNRKELDEQLSRLGIAGAFEKILTPPW